MVVDQRKRGRTVVLVRPVKKKKSEGEKRGATAMRRLSYTGATVRAWREWGDRQVVGGRHQPDRGARGGLPGGARHSPGWRRVKNGLNRFKNSNGSKTFKIFQRLINPKRTCPHSKILKKIYF
jgi:hypothetical protein